MKRVRDAEAELNLPPGFRFHPTDEELVVSYLCRKAGYQSLPVPIIAEIDLYKFNPWQLPEKALFGTKEWYFFTPRDRKYPNGSRPNRAAGSGYWKATGADKPIRPMGGTKTVGIKKALVFYSGKSPKGIKTNWIMHEYRLAETNHSVSRKSSSRLDDWVLCRIYNKKNNWEEKIRDQMEESEGAEEVGVESLNTPESEFDSDTMPEQDDPSWPPGYSRQDYLQYGMNSWVSRKDSDFLVEDCLGGEESDWITQLNLEDLQDSLATLEAMPLPDFNYSDYFSSLYPQPTTNQLN